MFYWHVHHDVLVEWSDDIQKRIDHIKAEKPKNEQETRLRLLRPVLGKLPAELIEAGEAYGKAREAYDKAGEAYGEAGEAYYKAREACGKAGEAYGKAWEAYGEAGEAYYKAREACGKAGEDYSKEINALHAVECPNCPWDGETIFPS